MGCELVTQQIDYIESEVIRGSSPWASGSTDVLCTGLFPATFLRSSVFNAVRHIWTLRT